MYLSLKSVWSQYDYRNISQAGFHAHYSFKSCRVVPNSTFAFIQSRLPGVVILRDLRKHANTIGITSIASGRRRIFSKTVVQWFVGINLHFKNRFLTDWRIELKHPCYCVYKNIRTDSVIYAALKGGCVYIVSLQPPLWPPWLCVRITPAWPLTSAWWGVSPPTTSPCSSGRLSLTLRSVLPFLFLSRLSAVS